MRSTEAELTVTKLQQLEELLSQPTNAVVETCRNLKGDVILLGAGGKIGPSLAQMLRRGSELAGVRRRIFAVSRFGSVQSREHLERSGIEIIKCDLLDEAAVEKLPDAANVIFLAGMKFGSMEQKAKTWAMNTHLPAVICRKYRGSRIVAFSTGTVYGLTEIKKGGSNEPDAPAPIGEYAMSCLGRERMFEYFSQAWKTSVVLIRLNYACELRYGVLVDLARQVFNGQPIDLTTGYFNTIWQGDANAMALQCFSLASTPASVINITGPELLSVREVCETFGQLLGKSVVFRGTESPTAFISNSSHALRLFGLPQIEAQCLIRWVADWVKMGGPHFDKPTHFEARTGKY